MADVKTRADSIHMFLSGAGSDGGAQSDPDASLGGFRSSTRVEPSGFIIQTPGQLPELQILRMAGEDGEGVGTITRSDDDSLTYQAPGDTIGVAQKVLDTETKVLESGTPSLYVVVKRNGTLPFIGTLTFKVVERLNGAIGFDDVNDSERAAGDDEYRGVVLKNESGSDIENLRSFLGELATSQTTDVAQLPAAGAGTIETSANFNDADDEGYFQVRDSGGTLREIGYYSSRTSVELTVPATGRGLLGTTASAGAATDTVHFVPGLRIAKEAPSSQPSGSFQTIPNENTAPTGVTFDAPITDAGGIDTGELDAGFIGLIWMHRQVPSGMIATARQRAVLKHGFDAAT